LASRTRCNHLYLTSPPFFFFFRAKRAFFPHSLVSGRPLPLNGTRPFLPFPHPTSHPTCFFPPFESDWFPFFFFFFYPVPYQWLPFFLFFWGPACTTSATTLFFLSPENLSLSSPFPFLQRFTMTRLLPCTCRLMGFFLSGGSECVSFSFSPFDEFPSSRNDHGAVPSLSPCQACL